MPPSAKTLKISRSFQKNKVSSAIFLKPISTWHHVCLYQKTATGPTNKTMDQPWSTPLSTPQASTSQGPWSSEFNKWIAGTSSNGKSKHNKTGQFGKQKQNNPGFVEDFFFCLVSKPKKTQQVLDSSFFPPEKWWVTYLKVKIDGTNTRKVRFVKGPCKAICRDG